MKIHLRTDNEELNSKREFACGIGPDLPEGDQYLDTWEQAAAHLMCHPEKDHCVGCFGNERPALGTPLSKLSGRPRFEGDPQYEEFKRIARSWGYD